MKQLKQNSDDIEVLIYQILQQTLDMLKQKYEINANILKNDFSELQRQEMELSFVEEFMMKQAHESDPIHFLQIWDSYQEHLKSLSRETIKLSEVSLDLKLEGRPEVLAANQTKALFSEDNAEINVAKLSQIKQM